MRITLTRTTGIIRAIFLGEDERPCAPMTSVIPRPTPHPGLSPALPATTPSQNGIPAAAQALQFVRVDLETDVLDATLEDVVAQRADRLTADQDQQP